MNDLITPLLLVFIGEHMSAEEEVPVEAVDVSKLSETVLQQVEADVYWCITKLLDNIQVRVGVRPELGVARQVDNTGSRESASVTSPQG